MTPQQRRARTLAVLIDQLVGLTRRRPVLIVLEDAHWIDPTTLELFDQTIRRIQPLPALLVVTFRPEFAPPWIRRPLVTELQLSRLSHSEGVAIVTEVSGKALPAEVAGQIVASADGVPLFLEELTKAVLESGLLRDDGDRYSLPRRLMPLAVPATLRDSLMARLDRLGPVKEVVQVASCIGREFSYEFLAAIAPLGAEQLQDALRQIMEAELVFCHGTLPEVVYNFKHALVRDVAYEFLLRSRRQLLHTRIARLLRDRFPDLARVQPELLAHHLTEGGLTEEAIAYWRRAGERASEHSAYLEAQGHLAKGLALLGDLPETPERIREEVRLQIRLGVSLIALKGYAADQVGAAYLRARELCEQAGEGVDLFAAMWGLWAFHQFSMRLEAREHVDELLRRADGSGDPELVLQAHHAAWTTCMQRGEFRTCLDHARQGIGLYNKDRHHHQTFRYGGHDPGTCCRQMAAHALCLLGYPDQAVAQAREALALARELGHPASVALALIDLSVVHQYRREPRLTREQADMTAAFCAEHSIGPNLISAGAVMRGWAMAAEYGSGTGVAEAQLGLEALQTRGARFKRSYYLALLGETYARAGLLEEASAAVSDGLALAETTGERFWVAEIYRLRGEFLLAGASDNRQEAEDLFNRALDSAHAQGAKLLELRTTASLARLWAERGERVRAQELLASVRGSFSEGFDTPDLIEAKALLEALA